MSQLHRFVGAGAVAVCIVTSAPAQLAQRPTIEQFLAPASPLEVRAAARTDRLAWVTYERGMRNVYTAAAPDFKPVRLTHFLNDDGTDLTNVEISEDGSTVTFIRGSNLNGAGWVANPSHDPGGAERAIWAIRTAGGVAAWKVAVLGRGSAPVMSPDGRYVLFVRDSQVYRARVSPTPAATPMERGEVPFIKEWGQQSNPHWSPDGSKIAFVSTRLTHAFIGIYDGRARTVSFVAPSVDFDGSPTWSPDGKQIAFVRRPGTPFAQQAQITATAAAAPGGGRGTAAPNAAAGRGNGRGSAAAPAGRGSDSAQTGRGAAGGRGDSASGRGGRATQSPGLYQARFRGGYTVSVMVADLANGTAKEIWHNAPDDRVFTAVNNLRWAADRLVFPLAPMNDEWERYYSLAANGTDAAPLMITTTNGLIEDATSAAYSADGKTLFYCTNANDIERRHIWAVSTAGGAPRQLSTGDGIETYPAPLASGKSIAVLFADARRPQSLALVAAAGGAPRVITSLPKDFPMADEVVPEVITYRSPDSTEIHAQLFVPKGIKPGERRPTMIFVHGGPQRQMLPGYHYMQFYHWAYAVNQWLASQGYVVMSINYRSGIGYGRKFRTAPNTYFRGNSEYQDVTAGAAYLKSRADVDPRRLGIWGLSYGGLLTSQALARNSDIFVAGADLAGVHLSGNTLDSTAVTYQSSTISQIDKWKSPVFLVQGDDDRNVDFSQMVGLVQLLRARDIYYELTVIPDDVHESLMHSRWIDVFSRMGAFLKRFVWDGEKAPNVLDAKK
jgi:dipeptidyl-peptidase-4